MVSLLFPRTVSAKLFPAGHPQHASVLGAVPSQVQDFAPPFAERHSDKSAHL